MDDIGSLLIGIGIVCAAFEGDIAPLICIVNRHTWMGSQRNVRSRAGFWTPAMTRRSSHSGGRRPKTAKARSRGK
jgi:hypothetical protein